MGVPMQILVSEGTQKVADRASRILSVKGGRTAASRARFSTEPMRWAHGGVQGVVLDRAHAVRPVFQQRTRWARHEKIDAKHANAELTQHKLFY